METRVVRGKISAVTKSTASINQLHNFYGMCVIFRARQFVQTASGAVAESGAKSETFKGLAGFCVVVRF